MLFFRGTFQFVEKVSYDNVIKLVLNRVQIIYIKMLLTKNTPLDLDKIEGYIDRMQFVIFFGLTLFYLVLKTLKKNLF